jgi:hypothetical protein
MMDNRDAQLAEDCRDMLLADDSREVVDKEERSEKSDELETQREPMAGVGEEQGETSGEGEEVRKVGYSCVPAAIFCDGDTAEVA